jgi:hypothetical protein
MGAKSYPDNLVFRVAVREIEAWLLADHVGMGKLLVAGATNLPRDPDLLVDPKQVLLQLASKAPRVVQNDLLVDRERLPLRGLVTIREWAISFAIRGIQSARHWALGAYAGRLIGCGKWRKGFKFCTKLKPLVSSKKQISN